MAPNYKTETHTDKNGYTYQSIINDPHGVRIYTLKNGLKVFLAQNFDAPKIQTYIPVRTGSNNDPADNTGLSHYLEHMMFKGTSKLGTLDWDKEKSLLNEISELFEKHKAEENPEKKKEIYRQIDEISQETSKYALANEYDKAISSLGATGTNAHTWLDETVYKNNIPANELEKWLKIESERFSNLVLRLFHTELESVYEEFNRAQDNDARLVNNELMDALFPTHPNGQQTTLGKAEHLKNPSMKAIHKYFEEYYVPNNYAMVLVGDLDFEKTIQLVDQYFGPFEYRELPQKIKILEQPQTEIVKRTVKSPTIARVQIAWRTDGYGTREAMLADVAANILSNRGEAGLLDLNINQKQSALWAQAFAIGFREYGYVSAVIVPKEEQTLDEGMQMLLEQINLIKKGEFPEWLIPAIINDFRVQQLKTLETADGLASNLYDVYIKGRTWEQELREMDDYSTITKTEVVDFANAFFKENFVAIFKENGENDKLLRVENPGITPLKINREGQSEYLKNILAMPAGEISAEFVNYGDEIKTETISGKKLSFVRNKSNDLAQVHFIFPFGGDHDNKLALSTQLLQYLGTEKFSPQELKEEFFKIGVAHDFKTLPDQLDISITGLEKNIRRGIELLQHWITDAKPEQAVYDNFVKTILEGRDAAKKDKNRIMNALVNYAKFGAFSRTTDVLTTKELQSINAKDLTDRLCQLFTSPYEVFYFGNDYDKLKTTLEETTLPETLPVPPKKIYPEPETGGNVYFVNYDMVQMEMSRVAKGQNVNTANFGKINVFNEYFGRGLSSIVFQEIRESKSLAYSAYVTYGASGELGHPDYVTAYIGTQPDKLGVAADTMNSLMTHLPEAEKQFQNARKNAMKQILAGRITRTNMFFNYKKLQKLGISHDFREDIFKEIEALDFESLKKFYENYLGDLKYNTAIIGKRENLDMAAVEKLGTFRELSLEEVFGY